MQVLLAARVVALLTGCSGNGGGPSLKAFSDSDGVLHVNGSGWKDCGRVTVDLPEPWTASEQTIGENGRFSLVYAHPLVKPYEGAVTATCAESLKQKATTEIRIGDPRSRGR